MKNQIKKLQRNLSGTILPLAITFIAALIPLSGLSVDIGYFGILRSSMEKATEAAAVAGAQEYFRNRADAGKAINTTVRTFKMNIAEDTMVGNFQNPTGPGQPSTLTYTKTFTQADGIKAFYREAPITLTVMTNLERGKISVTSDLTPKPFFATFLANTAMISITKEAELPPMDVAFVIDLSGSMRFATIMTYIGTARVEQIGMPGTAMLLNDVILYQSQSQNWGLGAMITANGLVTTIDAITDVLTNSPNVDIHIFATYDNGMRMYNFDPDRDYITNTQNSQGLRRTALTGLRLDPLRLFSLPDEARSLYDTFQRNRSLDPNVITTYFNMLAPYIEPIASASYGVKSFIDTVRIYGTAALKVGLCSFSSSSSSMDTTSTVNTNEYEGNNISKRIRTTFPYIDLVSPPNFNTIIQNITIMSTGGNGTIISPINTYAFPNGGTNINAGLDNGKVILDRSDRPGSERIIILFTDGEPTSHTFSALGTKVKSLTDAKIKVYSVVLTLAIPQASIDQFKYQVENVGKAEPVIFINNPAKLKEAFLQIADELGLKLVN